MLAPTPIAAPKAAERFIKGKVTARPDMASGPTPCPMKMLSTILYSDDATIATMAGMAYCNSRLPTGRVPNSKVACLLLTFENHCLGVYSPTKLIKIP
ncbi:MAG: hypothetical protein IJ895_00935 [Prevotella sp.]|nr:hypothetical protein [Prevotella sp.]